ncbi:Tim44 domain-containing protein [Pelotalea chapellei]|uniref:39S ribosomal protein L45 n=1 Tax=Pelotalea chapellei TaxID=44671 RepID=A0ABS5UC10_9BACT|nr:Tim44 domain-containing protein [Pelotalea chapellei]MBT1073214.1 39S ribosomal protein L45 [Pelotalea chapellei]
MNRNVLKPFILLAAFLFLSMTVLETSAHARAGGSRSMGSRGSRSYSQPSNNYTRPAAPRQQAAPAPFQQQPQSGGFLRSMAGGMVGGMLGGMLFRSLGFAGPGGGMGGGIGLFEILLLAGIGFFIYRFIKKRSAGSAAPYDQYDQGRNQGGYQAGSAIPASSGYTAIEEATADTGLAHIRQMDSTFDEERFNDMVMDHFFKIQGAWMNRDLSTASLLLTEEMKRIFQEDMNRLLQEKRTNRLENIAVRNVEITEVWQESGQDYITTLIYANLLDYTTDDNTGAVVSGSKTDPVKFEEHWTFTRPVGNNPWRLSAISQV